MHTSHGADATAGKTSHHATPRSKPRAMCQPVTVAGTRSRCIVLLPSHHCNGAGVRNGNPYRHSALYSIAYRAAIGPICIMA
jgi:hypothetical protein